MKAIIYCRKSTESEERQALSIPAQIEWATDFAEQNNLEVIEVIEESKSAKKPGRAGFNKMLEKINTKIGEVTIITDALIGVVKLNPLKKVSIFKPTPKKAAIAIFL